MALSGFLRNACRSNKGFQTLSLATKYSSISSTALNRNYVFDNRNHSLSNALARQNGMREISTTPVRMSGHDHAKLWTIERALSAILVPATPIALMYPSIATDVLMAVSLVMHVHWGIEAVAIDYVRPIIFGSAIAKLALGLVYLISVGTLVGLLNLIFNGPGFGNSIRELWKV